VVCSAAVGTKTAPRIIQLWFKYFAASFLETLDNERLIIWKFPKSTAGRTTTSRGTHAARGPRVWDPCFTPCSFPLCREYDAIPFFYDVTSACNAFFPVSRIVYIALNVGQWFPTFIMPDPLAIFSKTSWSTITEQ